MKNNFPLVTLSLAFLLTASTVFAGFRKTDLLYEETFNSLASLSNGSWEGFQKRHFEAGKGQNGTNALHFHSATLKSSDWIHHKLDAKKLSGGLIMLEATVRGLDIEPSQKSYLGTKIMLAILRNGKASHPEPAHLSGTFDWRTCMLIQQLGDDVDSITLGIGLQETSGDFWFDSIRIYRCIEVEDDSQEPPPENLEAKQIKRGPGFGAKYRGVMSGNDLSPESFNTLSSWNVNLIRYQMLAHSRDISTPEKYLAWIDDELAAMDTIYKRCVEHNIMMCIDLHSGPGMRKTNESSNLLMDGETNLNVLDEAWRKIASRFKGKKNIYGYDLLNEPKVTDFMTNGDNPWQIITERLVKVIRKIDPDTPIITEPNFRNFTPVDDPHIIYSPHFYSPHDFTHQGVGTGRSIKWSYPGYINGQYWDKEALRVALRYEIEFAQKYNVKMFIGEFSAACWAKGADKYLRDCIELFEEYGWDWTYHAYREASIWDLEREGLDHGKVRPATTDTPRKRVILKGLERNARRK